MPTIKDVAARSGVGIGTVSRVLNGGKNVNKETQEKVLNAIKELKYSPNSLGAKLRTNQNKVFALLIPLINHSFFLKKKFKFYFLKKKSWRGNPRRMPRVKQLPRGTAMWTSVSQLTVDLTVGTKTKTSN